MTCPGGWGELETKLETERRTIAEQQLAELGISTFGLEKGELYELLARALEDQQQERPQQPDVSAAADLRLQPRPAPHRPNVHRAKR